MPQYVATRLIERVEEFTAADLVNADFAARHSTLATEKLLSVMTRDAWLEHERKRTGVSIGKG